MLIKRIITAIILIPIALLAIFLLPPVSFFLFTGFVTLIAAWEWTYLMELKSPLARFIYLVLMVFMFYVITFFVPLSFIFWGAVIWWLFATLLIVLYPRASSWWSKGVIWRGIMGMLVLIPCWVVINYIRNKNLGIYVLLFLFILIWGADSFAYFVGRKWGKHPLAPYVSPKKSLEGFLGGIICTILICFITVLTIHVQNNLWPYILLLAVVTVLFSVVGDLFESMLKRQAGVKDSSNLLPGHGGFLDRIDSLTAAAPIFAFCAIQIGKFLS